MNFHLFRISLRPISGLFVLRNTDGSSVSRRDWLYWFFGEKRRFFHYGKEFVFVPEKNLKFVTSTKEPTILILGWIARATEQFERTAPEEGLEPTRHRAWQACFVAIDPSDHADGQKMAIEDQSAIGKPGALAASLAKEMSRIQERPFLADILPIIEEGSFWKFAAEHGNKIRSVTFDVSAPNMFDDADDFQKEMSRLRDNVRVSKVKATLESDTTLNYDDEGIRQIVDYTEKGAGELRARAVDGEIYHSGANIKAVEIEVSHHNQGVSEFLRQVVRLLGRIF